MLALALGCADSPTPPASTPVGVAPAATLGPSGSDPNEAFGRASGAFHSQRFRLRISLPDGKSWRIDDHRAERLVAKHPATGTVVELLLFREDEIMSRQKCMSAAERRGLIERHESLDSRPADLVLAREVLAFPQVYDTTLWLVVDPVRARASDASAANDADKRSSLQGSVLAAGAFLRQCLFFRATTVMGKAHEAELGARLALLRTKIFGSIVLDPARTADDYLAPKESHTPGAPAP